MSRMVTLIIVLVVLIGAAFFLSTMAKEKPTQTIEVAVPEGNAA